jgi:pimeloyl-ACP methyl ester carboxylesterase
MLLNLPNGKIFYAMEGEGSEVILFLHGLGSNSKDWADQIKFFKKDYFCIALDLRGHGFSSHESPLDIPAFARDIVQLIHHLKIEKLHLVGLSLGGMVAFQIAVDEPKLLKTLTIVNALPELVLKGFRRKLAFYMRLILVRIFGMKILAKILAPKLFPQKNQLELRQKLIKNFAQNNRKSYLEILSSIQDWSVSERLSAIKCPTLFLAAENDYTSLAEKRFFAEKINAKIVEIKNSNHALPAEKPDEFNKILQEFLRSN